MRKAPAPRRAPEASGANRFRKLLFADTNLRVGLNAIRRVAQPSEISAFFDIYWKVPAVRQQIARECFPSDVSWRKHAIVLNSRSLETEVIWLTNIFLRMHDELSQFVRSEKDYNLSIVKLDYENAQQELDNLSLSFGYSRWLIRQQVCLYTAAEKKEERAAFVNDTVDRSDGSLFGFFAYFHALRTDSDVSRGLATSQLDRFLQQANQTEFANFSSWILGADDFASLDDAPALMAYDELSPLFDRYLGFRLAIERLAVSPAILTPHTREKLAVMANAVGDESLSRAVTLLNAAPPGLSEVSRRQIELFDAYTAGDYAAAYDLGAALLDEAPENAALLEITARSYARSNDSEVGTRQTFWQPVVADMVSVYRRSDGLDDALVRLQRLTDAGMNVAYSRAVRSFLIRESTYDSSTKSRLYDALLAVAQETASPGHWRCLSQVAGARELFANVETDFPNSCAVALQRAVMDMDDQSLAELSGSVPKTRLEMYRGRVALESGDTAAAGKFFGAAASATFVADQLAAALGAVETRERDENLIGALEVVCDIVSRIPSAWRQFDIADLLQRIEGHCLETAYRSIELPTAHEIYSRHLSTDRDAQKADAAEEYVLSRGVERPSEIDTSSVSAGKLIPFLRDVCTPRTLDPFMALGDASAVELERIAICQVLTEIDSDNSSTYADEIRRITRRRIVRARLKQVEKSKIFVDVGNVKRQAEKRLREQFARFQELLSRPDYDRSFMKLISNVREIIGDSETLVHIADMPTDEREQSFRKLCSEVFALLLTSQEHGFKTYLSTRIKHGTLAAQISSSLSMNHLLLEANDGTFVRNGFWRDQLDLNVVEDDALHAVSERFSRQINEIISKLKNDWIQIKGDEHAEAWLDFSFFRTQILFLQSQIDEQTSFDEFFDIVLERFWKALDSNLATVRGRLDREIKPMLADELNAFESHAQAALPSVENLTPLWSAIAAARTDVQNSLDVIISWFRLTQSAERPDYDFGVAVDVAIESINSCFRARPINLTREGNVAKEMAGSTLESIVDILFILFENAITHSQSLLGPDVRLRVEAGDDMLLLEVENSVSESVASSIDNEALRAHLDDLRSDSSRAMVSREGGSGFPKIVKIIRHDLNAENSISAQLVDDNIFRIGLSIESPGLFV